MVIFILIFIFQINMLHDLNATLVIAVIIVPTWWLFHGSSWLDWVTPLPAQLSLCLFMLVLYILFNHSPVVTIAGTPFIPLDCVFRCKC